MTERYGPEDAGVPSWEPPSGTPQPIPPRFSPSTPGSPPVMGTGTTPGAPFPGVPTFRSWQPGFMPLRPLQLGDFLSLPMKAISANRAVILGGPLLCVVVAMLSVAVAVTLWVIDQQDFFLYPNNSEWAPWSGRTVLACIVAVLLLIFTDAAARVLVVPGVSRGILGERITLGKAWSITRPRIPQILFFYFLVSILAVGFVLALQGLVAIGAVALVVPIAIVAIPGGLLAIVMVGVAVSAIILERISAVASFRRAFSLVRGSAWRLIGNFFVIYLVLSMVSGAITGVAEAVVFGVALSSPSLGTLIIVTIVFTVVTTVVSTVVGYSFLGSLYTLMYVDLRIRSEGFDVDLARAAEAAARR